MTGLKGMGDGMSSRRRDHLIYGRWTEFDRFLLWEVARSSRAGQWESKRIENGCRAPYSSTVGGLKGLGKGEWEVRFG